MRDIYLGAKGRTVIWRGDAGLNLSQHISYGSSLGFERASSRRSSSGISSLRVLPIGISAVFDVLLAIPVMALSHLLIISNSFLRCWYPSSIAAVSSANCPTVCSCSPIVTPLSLSSFSSILVSGSPMNRNSSGDSGHPCATPDPT